MPKRWWGHEHAWSKWRVVERGSLERMNNYGVFGKYFVQERECTECGITEMQSVTEAIDV